MLPTDKQERKETPMATGLLDYFPDALAAVAHVSHVGNEQHNPGEELHWVREKSSDHADCAIRHLAERGTDDDDGLAHSAKAAWRVLANLQIEIEAAEKDRQKETVVLVASFADDKAYQEFCNVEPGIAVPVPTDSYKELAVLRYQAFGSRKLTLVEREAYIAELRDNDCDPQVAEFIASGVSCPPFIGPKTTFTYIAGPMRGYPKLNFAAFDTARVIANEQGRIAISPADIDRAAGLPPQDILFKDEIIAQNKEFVYRDFHAIFSFSAEHGDSISMLPGWEKSTGATAEFFLARWLGLTVLDARTGGPLSNEAFRAADLRKSVEDFLEGNG